MVLVRLPPYSPELNPVEHLWDEIREKLFANRVFDSMGAVIAPGNAGAGRMGAVARIDSIIVGMALDLCNHLESKKE